MRREQTAVGIMVCAILCFAGTIASAAPPNDECADATPVSAGVTPFCSIGATTDGPELPASCDEGFGLSFIADVWFSYLATSSGDVCVSTCDAADFDTRLAVYDGACGDLTLVACNDDSAQCGGFTSRLTFVATAGTSYLIRLGGYSSRGCGSLLIGVQVCPSCPPSGHDCSVVGTPGCNDLDCCIAVCALDPFCCEITWDAACVDIASVLPSCSRTQYSCSGAEGPVANDCAPNCLPVAACSSVPFDTTNATTDGPATDCEYGKDIWYCVAIAGTGRLTVSVKGASFDPTVAIYDVGTSASFDPDDLPVFLLQCGDARTDGDETAMVASTHAGHVYLLQIAGAGAVVPESGTGTLNVCFVVPLANTGPSAPALFDPAAMGAFTLEDVGFATGRLVPNAAPTWFAQPITLPLQDSASVTWALTELHISACIPGTPGCVAACSPGGSDCGPDSVENQTMNVILWARSGTAPPTDADQLVTVSVPFPAANELVDSSPQNEDLLVRFDPPIELSSGDYYVTAYADSENPASAAAFVWLTNSTGSVIPLLDRKGDPFAYRASSFPRPGFEPFALGSALQLAQQPGLDDDKLYGQTLSVIGDGAGTGGEPCDRANAKMLAVKGILARIKTKNGQMSAGNQSGLQELAQAMFMQTTEARGLIQQAIDQLNAIADDGVAGGRCVQFDVPRVVTKLGLLRDVIDVLIAELTTLIADQNVTAAELALAQSEIEALSNQAIAIIELIESQLSGCPTDLNHDNAVDAADLAVLIASWGMSGAGDFDEDGLVAGADLAILLGSWGPCGP